METVTFTQLRRNYREILKRVDKGPIQVTRYGKKMGVLVSKEQYEADKQIILDSNE